MIYEDACFDSSVLSFLYSLRALWLRSTGLQIVHNQTCKFLHSKGNHIENKKTAAWKKEWIEKGCRGVRPVNAKEPNWLQRQEDEHKMGCRCSLKYLTCIISYSGLPSQLLIKSTCKILTLWTISELLNQNLGLGNGLETHDAGIPVQEVRIFHTLEWLSYSIFKPGWQKKKLCKGWL